MLTDVLLLFLLILDCVELHGLHRLVVEVELVLLHVAKPRAADRQGADVSWDGFNAVGRLRSGADRSLMDHPLDVVLVGRPDALRDKLLEVGELRQIPGGEFFGVAGVH